MKKKKKYYSWCIEFRLFGIARLMRSFNTERASLDGSYCNDFEYKIRCLMDEAEQELQGVEYTVLHPDFKP